MNAPWTLVCSLTAGMAVTSAAFAADHKNVPEWKVTLGAGAFYGPEYEGSDDYAASAVPVVSVSWREMIHLNAHDGLGIDIYDHDPVTLSTWIGYDGGREEDDSDDLRGLGDIDSSAVARVNFSVDIGPVSPFVNANYYFSGSEGTEVEFGLSSGLPLFGDPSKGEKPGAILELGVSGTWVDENYMDSYFGITALQSSRSGLARFNPDSGVKSTGANVSLIVPIGDQWAVMTMLNYDRLIGDAADSPVIREENQLSGGLMLTWTWQD